MKESSRSDPRRGLCNRSMLNTRSPYTGALGAQGLTEGGEGWRLQGMAALTSLVTFCKTAGNQWSPLAVPGLAGLEVGEVSEV